MPGFSIAATDLARASRQFEIRGKGDGLDRIGVGIAVDVNRARLLVERGGDLLAAIGAKDWR